MKVMSVDEFKEALGMDNAAKSKRANSRLVAAEVRTYAIKALNQLSGLTQAQRRQVLQHMRKMNEV